MKDLCQLMEEAKKSRKHGSLCAINLDPEKRADHRRQRQAKESKYRRIMECD